MTIDQTVEEIRLDAVKLSLTPGKSKESIQKFDEALDILTSQNYNGDQYAEILVDKVAPLRGEKLMDQVFQLLDEVEVTKEENTHYISGRVNEERAVISGVYEFKSKEDLVGALENINLALMDYELARTNQTNEIRTIPELNHRIKRVTGVKAVIYSNLANSVEDQTEKTLYQQESERFALQEIEMREMDNEVGGAIQNAYHTLACSYVGSQKFDKAEELLSKAIEVGDETTEEVDIFLNYRLAVNSFKQNGNVANEQSDKYIANLIAGSSKLRKSLVEYTQGNSGWNGLEEMASPELKPKIDEFYKILKD